jgi:hypothetical protein
VTLKDRLRRALRYDVAKPAHRPIEGIDYSAQIRHEEFADLAYALPFIVGALTIMSGARIPLFEWLLGFWGGYFATTICTLLVFVLIYELHRNHKMGLLHAVMLYPCVELEIRELGKKGWENHLVHLWIEDRKPLNIQPGQPLSDHLGKPFRQAVKPGAPNPGKGEPPQLTVSPGIESTVLTCAYRQDDDLLRQFTITTQGPLSSHEGIRDIKRVYRGLLGIEREVIRLSSVVAKRGQDDQLLLYLTDSSELTRNVLNLGGRLQAEDPDIFATERAHVYSLVKTATDKVRTLEAEIDSKEHTIKDLQQRLSKKDSDKLSDPFFGTEPPPERGPPLFGRRVRQALIVIAIVGVVAAAALLGLNLLVLYGAGA